MLLSLYVYKLTSTGCIAPVGCLPSMCETLNLTLNPQNKAAFLVI